MFHAHPLSSFSRNSFKETPFDAELTFFTQRASSARAGIFRMVRPDIRKQTIFRICRLPNYSVGHRIIFRKRGGGFRENNSVPNNSVHRIIFKESPFRRWRKNGAAILEADFRGVNYRASTKKTDIIDKFEQMVMEIVENSKHDIEGVPGLTLECLKLV